MKFDYKEEAGGFTLYLGDRKVGVCGNEEDAKALKDYIKELQKKADFNSNKKEV